MDEKKQSKPEQVKLKLQHNNIKEISFGHSQYLLLTDTGLLYGARTTYKNFLSPILIKPSIKSLITSIYCFGEQSFALKVEGSVYHLNQNQYFNIKDNESEVTIEPNLLNISNVKSMANLREELYILTIGGSIYFYENLNNLNNYLPTKMEMEFKFLSLYSITHKMKDYFDEVNEIFADIGVYIYILKGNTFRKTVQKTILEFLCQKSEYNAQNNRYQRNICHEY